jgi:hypothetical protein
MLSVAFLFILVLIASFAAVMFMTRPTVEEKRVRQRLDDIAVGKAEGLEEPDLLRQVSYSDVALLDKLFRSMALARRLKSVIAQANSTWTVGRLMATTLLVFAVAAWLASVLVPSAILGSRCRTRLSALRLDRGAAAEALSPVRGDPPRCH